MTAMNIPYLRYIICCWALCSTPPTVTVTAFQLLPTIRPTTLSSSPIITHTHLHSSTSDDQQQQESTQSQLQSQSQSASRLRALKLINLTKATNPALLSDYLMEIGASSVSITDHDKDTEHEAPIFAEPDDSDIFAAVICGDAAVGKNVWLRCDVTAHFADSFDITGVVDDIRSAFDMATVRYEVDDVPDLDWILEVQSSWKPFVVGGFVLRFPWHTDDDVKEMVDVYHAEKDDNDDYVELGDGENYQQLLLEGGIAFGTGEHPTTQLCLRWIRDLLKSDEQVELFLDYGAGSGVLGIAACSLEPNNLKSIGVEIDSDAIRIADENARNNNVNMKSYLPGFVGGDDESKSLIMKAMQRSKADVLPDDMNGPRFDACAANILAGPLVTLAETIAGMVRPGGKIGLSGILEWQSDDVVEAYAQYFDDTKVEETRRGWVLVTGTKKQQ